MLTYQYNVMRCIKTTQVVQSNWCFSSLHFQWTMMLLTVFILFLFLLVFVTIAMFISFVFFCSFVFSFLSFCKALWTMGFEKRYVDKISLTYLLCAKSQYASYRNVLWYFVTWPMYCDVYCIMKSFPIPTAWMWSPTLMSCPVAWLRFPLKPPGGTINSLKIGLY